MPLFRRPEDVAAELSLSAAAATDPWARDSALSSASDIRSGVRMTRGGATVADATGRAVVRGAKGVESLLAPAGKPVLEGAGTLARWLYANPWVAKRLATGAMALPIIAEDFSPHAEAQTSGILAAQENPELVVNRERVTMASLNEFLEKKAAASAAGGPWSQLQGGIIGGVGKGIGTGIADLLGSALGGLAGAAKDVVSTNPQRRALLKKLLDSDPVISDAVRRNPATVETLMEAYSTMLRYAPSLTVDTNAVRSFLREVVLGGGHVNYATIKNLIETEKAVNGAHGKGR